MATDTEKAEKSRDGLKDQAGNLVNDVKSEVTDEVNAMHATGAIVNPAHSDRVVRRHIFGLSVGFFIAIVIFLVLVIAGFMIFGQR